MQNEGRLFLSVLCFTKLGFLFIHLGAILLLACKRFFAALGTFLITPSQFMLTLLAQAGPGANQSTWAMLLNTVLPFVVLGIFFWFLFIRPQRKEAQRLEVFRSNLKAGDEVVTNQGIYGTISSISDFTVQLEIARGTRIKILKQEIRAYAKETDTVEKAIEAAEEVEALEREKREKEKEGK